MAANQPAKTAKTAPGVKPIPASIVYDERDTKPKRVIQLVLGILLVLLVARVVQFEISRDRSASKAEHERAQLIIADQQLADSVDRLVDTAHSQGDSLHNFGHDLRLLRRVIQQQNTDLIAAGLVPVHIPKIGATNEGGGASDPGSPSTPRSSPTGAPPPSPHPSHSPDPRHPPGPHPSKRPTPKPSPSPTPVCQLPVVGPIVCNPVVGQPLLAAVALWSTLGLD